ncbi:hypothetical protein SAMN04489745_3641 [Arthrobacter woluwensis]|uniref:Uncharacterized protein n=1 Tax=Arthrobacter woluwensis TaxID=156980 RepID=A0A1H4X4H1_9MICC|nr:hypothetical protein SAMN04489745_3641 [Arthrobacter woluwensis]
MIDTYTGSTVVVDDELAESLGSQYVPEDEYEARRGASRQPGRLRPGEPPRPRNPKAMARARSPRTSKEVGPWLM